MTQKGEVMSHSHAILIFIGTDKGLVVLPCSVLIRSCSIRNLDKVESSRRRRRDGIEINL